MSHEHDVDGAYLQPSDCVVTGVSGAGDDLTVKALLPCPECDQPLEVAFGATGELTESDVDFPLDDAEAALD